MIAAAAITSSPPMINKFTPVSFRKPLCFNQGRNEGSRRRKPYGVTRAVKRFSFPASFSRPGGVLVFCKSMEAISKCLLLY